jgi:hypothetical protein
MTTINPPRTLTPADWRALTALDCGPKGVRADILLNTQKTTPLDVSALYSAGLIKGFWAKQPHAQHDLSETIYYAPRQLVRIKLTRAGLQRVRSAENNVRRSFRRESEKPTVGELRKRSKVSHDVLAEMQRGGWLEIFTQGGSYHVDYSDQTWWQIRHGKYLQAALTTRGREARPKGGFV